MLLEVTNLSKRFGGLKAVSNVSLAVEKGEVRGIIGPNGSGKSTLFNLISGVYTPEPGARLALLVGAEGPGLTEPLLHAAHLRLRIPMRPGVDSLNLVVATSIAMHRLFGR